MAATGRLPSANRHAWICELISTRDIVSSWPVEVATKPCLVNRLLRLDGRKGSGSSQAPGGVAPVEQILPPMCTLFRKTALMPLVRVGLPGRPQCVGDDS